MSGIEVATATPTAHTPGPWTWHDGHTLRAAEPDYRTSAVHTILSSDGGECGYLSSPNDKTMAELDADRILIAAAPCLLAELKNIVKADRHNKEFFPTADEFINWAQSRARAAIAKATGVAQ